MSRESDRILPGDRPLFWDGVTTTP